MWSSRKGWIARINRAMTVLVSSFMQAAGLAIETVITRFIRVIQLSSRHPLIRHSRA
jgi:hypothetical protein